MKQLPYYNDQPHAVFVGAVMIPPGHTRLVDAALLPQPEADPAGGQRKGVLGAIAARLLDESSQQQDGGLQQPNQPPGVEETPKQDAEKDSEHPEQDTEQEQVAE